VRTFRPPLTGRPFLFAIKNPIKKPFDVIAGLCAFRADLLRKIDVTFPGFCAKPASETSSSFFARLVKVKAAEIPAFAGPVLPRQGVYKNINYRILPGAETYLFPRLRIARKQCQLLLYFFDLTDLP